MANFWQRLNTPFTVLAPMEDVTDVVFREIMATELPRPDVFFTEFTSIDGLATRGRAVTIRKLQFTPKQRPIVAQVWGTDPERMRSAAETVRELGFDGIDINMGCPVPAVIKRKAGAGTIGHFSLAAELVGAIKDGSGTMAVSVKTRLGQDRIITDEWIPFLLNQGIDALTIHGRIATQMSKGEANWDEIGKAVKHRDQIAPGTVIIGNGDVLSYEQAIALHEQYRVDGIMVGRGIFHNPWIFSREQRIHSKSDFLTVLHKHLDLYESTWGRSKNFEMMKKFFKMYVKDFPGAAELRQELMSKKTYEDMVNILKRELKTTA